MQKEIIVKSKMEKLAILIEARRKMLILLDEMLSYSDGGSIYNAENKVKAWDKETVKPFINHCIEEGLVKGEPCEDWAEDYVQSNGLKQFVGALKISGNFTYGRYKGKYEAAKKALEAAQAKFEKEYKLLADHIAGMEFFEQGIYVSVAPDIAKEKKTVTIELHTAYLKDVQGNEKEVVTTERSENVFVYGLVDINQKPVQFQSEFHHLEAWARQNNIGIRISKTTSKIEI